MEVIFQRVILSLTYTNRETDGYSEGSFGLGDQQKRSCGSVNKGFLLGKTPSTQAVGFASE